MPLNKNNKEEGQLEEFFSSIGNELTLAEKQDNYKKLYKEESPLLEEFLTEATTDEEFVNYLIEAEDSTLAKLKQKISGLLNNIKSKLTGVFNKIFPYSIYTIGVGIGQSAKRLYGLFDSSGKIVVEPRLNTLKINDKLKTMNGSMTSKNGIDWNVHLSGFNMSNGSVVGVGKKKDAHIFYFSSVKQMPKVPQSLNAGKRIIRDSKAIKRLFEAAGLDTGGFDLDDEIGDEMMQIGQDVEDATLDSKEIESINKNLENVASNIVGYKEYANMILEKIEELSSAQRGKPEQIQVYGDSGIGKTQIVEQVAKYTKANYFYVQLDKLDQSLLKGIPAIGKEKGTTETGEEEERPVVNLVGSNMFPSDRDNDGIQKEGKKTQVDELANDIAKKYQSGNGVDIKYNKSNRWIIFFDEFNRAPEDATTIAMNILNTGAIVSAITKVYDEARDKLQLTSSQGMLAKLPENSVIIQAMNTPSQKNLQESIQNVGDMDIATVSRMTTGVTLETNLKTFKNNFALLPFWYEFKGGDKEIVFPRLPGIVTGYMDKLYKDALDGGASESEAQKAPFNELRSFGEGNYKSAMDPRAWTTAVADKMIKQAKKQWDKFSEEDKGKYEAGAKKLQDQIGKIVNKLKSTQKNDYENLIIADVTLNQLEKMYNRDIAKDDGWKNLLFSAFLSSPQRQMFWANTVDIAAGFGEEASKHIDDMRDAWTQKMKTVVKPEELILNYINLKSSGSQKYKNIENTFFGEDASIGKSNTIHNNLKNTLRQNFQKNKITTSRAILKLMSDNNYKLSDIKPNAEEMKYDGELSAKEHKEKAEEIESKIKKETSDEEIKKLKDKMKVHEIKSVILHIKYTIKEMYKDMADSGQLASIAQTLDDLKGENDLVRELHKWLKGWQPYKNATTQETETMAKEKFGKAKAEEGEE